MGLNECLRILVCLHAYRGHGNYDGGAVVETRIAKKCEMMRKPDMARSII